MRMAKLWLTTVVAMLGLMSPGLADERPVQFGLTSAVVRENHGFYENWAAYLESKLGRKVEFVQRRTYHEILELLNAGKLDFAWVCSYMYVKPRNPEFLSLLATPIYRGEPLYHAYLVVHRDSAFASMADLYDRIFAYSDPDSNTGYILPRAQITQMGMKPAEFFRLTFFTYSHVETIEAVAEYVADGTSVDAYVWDHLAKLRPDLTQATKIISDSEKFGFPPIVLRRGISPELIAGMRQALLSMNADKDGRALLEELMLDGFGVFPDELYSGLRQLAQIGQTADLK
jgi:phosphonate transport system substrate-binding protein